MADTGTGEEYRRCSQIKQPFTKQSDVRRGSSERPPVAERHPDGGLVGVSVEGRDAVHSLPMLLPK